MLLEPKIEQKKKKKKKKKSCKLNLHRNGEGGERKGRRTSFGKNDDKKLDI